MKERMSTDARKISLFFFDIVINDFFPSL
jgi:hypothetical protein